MTMHLKPSSGKKRVARLEQLEKQENEMMLRNVVGKVETSDDQMSNNALKESGAKNAPDVDKRQELNRNQ